MQKVPLSQSRIRFDKKSNKIIRSQQFTEKDEKLTINEELKISMPNVVSGKAYEEQKFLENISINKQQGEEDA